jgi:hypothetical protein
VSLLPEGQTGEAWESRNKAMIFRKDQKVRIDAGCLCIECNSCVDQKSCRALNTAQRYFDSLQPTVRKMQRSTWSCSYKHGNISNLPGCFWKYSSYGNRAPAMFWTERTKWGRGHKYFLESVVCEDVQFWSTRNC